MRPVITAAVLLLLHLSAGDTVHAGNWTFINGEDLPGDPVTFDFQEKTLQVINPLTKKRTIVPAKDLSLRSRQRLLFSPVFHKADTGKSLWPPEKRLLFFQAIALPAIVLFIGFWLSVWFVTGNFNPLLALIGFLGSWIVVAIFAVCYTFMQIRFGGSLTTTLIGVGFILVFTPLFVSAVYNCSYGKGHLIFHYHLIATLCFFSIGMVLTETIAGDAKIDAWWTRRVFEPLGLTAPEPHNARYFFKETGSRAT